MRNVEADRVSQPCSAQHVALTSGHGVRFDNDQNGRVAEVFSLTDSMLIQQYLVECTKLCGRMKLDVRRKREVRRGVPISRKERVCPEKCREESNERDATPIAPQARYVHALHDEHLSRNIGHDYFKSHRFDCHSCSQTIDYRPRSVRVVRFLVACIGEEFDVKNKQLKRWPRYFLLHGIIS